MQDQTASRVPGRPPGANRRVDHIKVGRRFVEAAVTDECVDSDAVHRRIERTRRPVDGLDFPLLHPVQCEPRRYPHRMSDVQELGSRAIMLLDRADPEQGRVKVITGKAAGVICTLHQLVCQF